MPGPSSLWLNGVPLTAASPQAIYQHVLHHSARIEAAPQRLFHVDAQTVYVFQREFAAVPRWPGLVLGSDRATTCHLLVAHSERSAFLAHLDGAENQMQTLVLALRDAFADHTDRVDVHLVGGFDDERGESQRLGTLILTALRHATACWPTATFHLRGCAFGANNTTTEVGHPAPRIRGLAFRTDTMELFPNAWFPDPQPLRWERAALSFVGCLPLAKVYDASTATYRFDPNWLRHEANGMLQYLLSLNDDTELLALTSTSPHAEDADYCDSLRATLRFLLARQAQRTDH